MIRPKFKLVRVYDQPLKVTDFVDDMVNSISRYKDVQVSNAGIGPGFDIKFGTAKNVKDYFYPRSNLDPEQAQIIADKIKRMLGFG